MFYRIFAFEFSHILVGQAYSFSFVMHSKFCLMCFNGTLLKITEANVANLQWILLNVIPSFSMKFATFFIYFNLN